MNNPVILHHYILQNDGTHLQVSVKWDFKKQEVTEILHVFARLKWFGSRDVNITEALEKANILDPLIDGINWNEEFVSQYLESDG